MNYKEAYVTNLIRERALKRAAAKGGAFNNEGCPRAVVPFPEWLYFHEGVVDWHELSKYHLWNFYLDYRVDVVSMGLLFESGEYYGLTNV